MSGKSINFDDKKINKSNFYKNKNIFKIDYIDVIYLNTSLDIMMMMSLYQYV